MAEQAKILVTEGEEKNLDAKEQQARWVRWSTCCLCEQHYHGVVRCALGWACWKAYVSRPEDDVEEIRAWLRASRRQKLICARLFATAVTVLAVVLAIRYGESTS